MCKTFPCTTVDWSYVCSSCFIRGQHFLGEGKGAMGLRVHESSSILMLEKRKILLPQELTWVMVSNMF